MNAEDYLLTQNMKRVLRVNGKTCLVLDMLDGY